MKTIITIMTTFLTSISLFACTCAGVDKFSEDDLNVASQIFKGRVIKIVEDTALNLLAVTFELSENYLDSSDLGNKTIYTFTKSAFCGIYVQLNDEWYIYAKNKDGLDFCNRCERSALLTIQCLDRNDPPDFYQEIKDVTTWYKYLEFVYKPVIMGIKRYNDDIEEIKRITAANSK